LSLLCVEREKLLEQLLVGAEIRESKTIERHTKIKLRHDGWWDEQAPHRPGRT
jgi:hypothetical protein